ncbi:hypothetical protein [Streptococcus equi]|uniref:hypothetical protein n=1 Tax=Streptococcus equi TaxID=1336 RepID=UPI001E62AA32|nr:hypothetical protein [Streptococcus equi]
MPVIFEALEQLAGYIRCSRATSVNALQEAPIRHSLLVTVADMQQAVEAILEYRRHKGAPFQLI